MHGLIVCLKIILMIMLKEGSLKSTCRGRVFFLVDTATNISFLHTFGGFLFLPTRQKGGHRAVWGDKLLSISANRGKHRGPRRTLKEVKKGLKLKWCPYKDCKTVTHYIMSHHETRCIPWDAFEDYQGLRGAGRIRRELERSWKAMTISGITKTASSTTLIPCLDLH